jgi:hypothetical protein
MTPADHDAIAARFSEVVDAVTDWDAATPVPEWRARHVVHHLTTWLPGLLGSCGVDLPVGDVTDPVGSWHRQTAAVHSLLLERGDHEVTHQFLGTRTIADLLATVYLGEVVAGMEQMEDVIRGSGHYGPRWPGDPGPDPQRRLLAFIGRDPDWSPG